MFVLETFFLISHLVAGSMWVGAVFMASLIDWQAIRTTVKPGRFPFHFVVDQGRRVFPWVYLAMALMWISGLGLTWLHPPATAVAWGLLGGKVLALGFMSGSTIYGTLSSWPKLQFSTDDEAFAIYGRYMIRAYIIFGSGVAALVLGALLSRSELWLSAS